MIVVLPAFRSLDPAHRHTEGLFQAATGEHSTGAALLQEPAIHKNGQTVGALQGHCQIVEDQNHGLTLPGQESGLLHELQLVGEVPEGLDILHESQTGRLKTLVVRGDANGITRKVSASNPVYFDVLPLSLEEIFIYELGGVNYEVKNILL